MNARKDYAGIFKRYLAQAIGFGLRLLLVPFVWNTTLISIALIVSRLITKSPTLKCLHARLKFTNHL